MGASFIVNVAPDTALVTTAETVVATLSGLSSQGPGQVVDLEGDVFVTTGATTSAVTLRVRQDSLTGAVVDEAPVETAIGAAGSSDPYRIEAEFAPAGELSGKTFVLTVQQTAATANGNVAHGYLKATFRP